MRRENHETNNDFEIVRKEVTQQYYADFHCPNYLQFRNRCISLQNYFVISTGKKLIEVCFSFHFQCTEKGWYVEISKIIQ